MKYVTPRVVTTTKASSAIQAGDPNLPKSGAVIDVFHTSSMTDNPAYESDE
jgi:hypothetical protein